MRVKRAFIVVSIAALIVTAILVSIKAYYVAVALVAGTFIIGHREFWSLVKKKKAPAS